MNATMDPALARLLEKLPKGNPDEAEPGKPDEIEVWIPGCRGRHVAKRGELLWIDFGTWWGPVTAWNRIYVHCRNVRTGVECRESLANARLETDAPFAIAGLTEIRLLGQWKA